MSVSFIAVDYNNPKTINDRGDTAPTAVIDSLFGYSINLCNGNAGSLLGLLGLGDMDLACGEITIPEARRAVMKARATFDSKVAKFTRDDEQHSGRMFSMGIDNKYLKRRLEEFADLVEAGAEAGATHISWV